MEIIEYGMGINRTNEVKDILDRYHPIMSTGHKLFSYLFTNVDEIVNKITGPSTKMGTVENLDPEISSIKVFEEGIVVYFSQWVEDPRYNESSPIYSRAYIYDNGEIHYVITRAPYCGFSSGRNDELVDELDNKMGNEIQLIPEKKGLAEKISRTKDKNERINNACKEKVRVALTRIKDYLDIIMSNNDDNQIEASIIMEIADYLNINARNWTIEQMVRVIKYEFSSATDDEIKSAIAKHLEYKSKLMQSQETIMEIERETNRKKAV